MMDGIADKLLESTAIVAELVIVIELACGSRISDILVHARYEVIPDIYSYRIRIHMISQVDTSLFIDRRNSIHGNAIQRSG